MDDSNGPLPRRRLGKTGLDVTIISLGGVKYNSRSERHAVAVVNRAIDLGINYIDTAHGYKDSERKIGLVLADRRDEVYLATKSSVRDGDGIRREIEESFRRLQTDHIDIFQVHDLKAEKELSQIAAPNGALRAIEEYVRDGSIRFVGVTGHRYPDLMARALREYSYDTLLVSLGGMQAAVRPFYETVMPIAREQDVGVVAMKVMAHGWFGEAGMAEDALRFVLGLDGVATALVGVDDVAQVEQNVRVVREGRLLADGEREAFLQRVRGMYAAKPDRAWFIYR
jgi:aryl-alcohol dehydrogenase-like predicted oxidoreductase